MHSLRRYIQIIQTRECKTSIKRVLGTHLTALPLLYLVYSTVSGSLLEQELTLQTLGRQPIKCELEEIIALRGQSNKFDIGANAYS